MIQSNIRKITLDSCVVIDLFEKPRVVKSIRAGLRGKQVKILLCDQVLREVQRVRGVHPKHVFDKLSRLLGRNVGFVKTRPEQRTYAGNVSYRYQSCHRGDNLILSVCRADDLILLTFDKSLLQTCGFDGVQAFHPSSMGGI